MHPKNPFLMSLLLTLSVSSANVLQSYQLKDISDIIVPTVNSKHEECRKHSLLYLQELNNFKLWATEMFDASSKFITGILAGSTYDLGNFDECVAVQVPYENIVFSGQHCLAKFTLTPPKIKLKNIDYYSQPYQEFYNVSAWDKIAAFSTDNSKTTRNELYFSFCIPSTCTHFDLEESLIGLIKTNNFLKQFEIDINVNRRNCQVFRDGTLDVSDIIFISVVSFFVFIALLATLYDHLLRLDHLEDKLRIKSEIFHYVVLCFSISRNLKKLAVKSEKKDLKCIGGIKTISMFFIIMGHRLMFIVGSPMQHVQLLEQGYTDVKNAVLLNGPIIVDTFFLLGGFLSSYFLLCEFSKKRKINFLFLYIHRIVRLFPCYAVVLAFYCTIFVKLSSGPFWNERIEVEQERCLTSWWVNLLYINNYVNLDNICMFQSWYLACDMHFFILATLITWFLWKKPIPALITIISLIFFGIAIIFFVVQRNNEDPILLLYRKLLRDPVKNSTFITTYIPSHMRFIPYSIGILTGYSKFKIVESGYKMSNKSIYLGWILSTTILLTTTYSGIIFYFPNLTGGSFPSSLYAAIHHFTWSISIAWFIIAVSSGYGTWIEPILTWNPFILLSRITYTAFLCHGAIQILSAAIVRSPIHFTYFTVVELTLSDIVLAYISGLLLSIFFEAPLIGLEKLLYKPAILKEKLQTQTTKI